MMPPRLFSLLLLACSWPLATGGAATRELERSRQCLVVLANNWTSTTGVMHAFERDTATAAWKERGPAISVVLGKNGLGEGRGLVDLDFQRARKKQEGDKRAPAGIFRLPSAFGYASKRSAAWIKLPYLASSAQTEGVDDPHSLYYNKLVDRSRVAQIDWRSSEKMRRADVLYKWGVLVDHNPSAIPGRRIVHIFAHLEERRRADGRLHGHAGTRSGEITPLAGSRASSDSGPDAARGLSSGPGEIWFAARTSMKCVRVICSEVFASRGTLLP